MGLAQATQMVSSRVLSTPGAVWCPSSSSNRSAAAQGEPRWELVQGLGGRILREERMKMQEGEGAVVEGGH